MEASDTDLEGPVDWAQLIVDYQSGPKAEFGPALISQLEAYIAMAAAHFRPLPPAIEAEDIHQQMVLEVLDEAGRMPLPLRPKWVPRQLLLRSSQSVARWLAHETAPALVELGEALAEEPGTSISAVHPEFTSIGLSEEDLTLLHRFHVLDERTEDLADEAGVSPDTLRRRVSRARDRGRRSLASRIQRAENERRQTHNERSIRSDSGHRLVQLRNDGTDKHDSLGPGLPSRRGRCFPDSH
ncbi:MAG: hypothetical protein M3O87_04365 [Candidatus Dormibacteraeota bacterium]|nr:hypothetical protein [Candidatus Dormibacteraeota bacterium]